MSFDEHRASCPKCGRNFGLCRVGLRLLVEDVDALSRQSKPLQTKGSA